MGLLLINAQEQYAASLFITKYSLGTNYSLQIASLQQQPSTDVLKLPQITIKKENK